MVWQRERIPIFVESHTFSHRFRGFSEPAIAARRRFWLTNKSVNDADGKLLDNRSAKY
jgi:hypothetical protein